MTGRRDLCIMACIFCREPAFLKWVQEFGGGQSTPINEAGAKAFITTLCRVKSRNDLDTDPAAAERFHELVRKPFVQWKEDVANAYTPDDSFYEGMHVPGGLP